MTYKLLTKCHLTKIVGLTFFLVSVSVSVPVDLEDTGLSVPSTLSSRRILSGDGGIVVVEAILLLLLLVLLISVTGVELVAIIEVVFSVVPVPVVNLNEKRDLSMKESGTETENNL